MSSTITTQAETVVRSMPFRIFHFPTVHLLLNHQVVHCFLLVFEMKQTTRPRRFIWTETTRSRLELLTKEKLFSLSPFGDKNSLHKLKAAVVPHSGTWDSIKKEATTTTTTPVCEATQDQETSKCHTCITMFTCLIKTQSRCAGPRRSEFSATFVCLCFSAAQNQSGSLT